MPYSIIIYRHREKFMVCKKCSNTEMNTDAEIFFQMWAYTLKINSPNMTKNSEYNM